MKSKSEKIIIRLAVILLILALFETVLSNFTALSVIGKEKTSLNLSAYGKSQRGVAPVGDWLSVTEDVTLTFSDLDTEIRSVSISAKADKTRSGIVKLSICDSSAAEAYKIYTSGYFYSGETNYYRIRSTGEATVLRIQFQDEIPCIITDITLNDAPPFGFSLVRFLLLFLLVGGLYLIWEYQYWKVLFSADNKNQRTVLAIILLLTILGTTAACLNVGFVEMPLSKSNPNAYEQLFASLLDGRVNLDVNFDTKLLDALDNPYDKTQRTFLDIKNVCWDRAYYDGNFYCYFGIAPILTVYYPIYFLSLGHYIPSIGMATLLLLIGAIIGLYLALRAFGEKYRIDIPFVLLCLGIPVLTLCNLLPMIGSSSDMYYLPYASAFCFCSFMLYFGIKAMCIQTKIVRFFALAASGICLALTVASRPTFAVYLLLLIPSFWEWIRKEKKWWQDAICFAVPVLIGAALLMWYNYIRFASPFEFGTSYQLTVSDIRSNKLQISLLGDAVFHYYLQMPELSGLFPYFRPGKLDMSTYGQFFYTTKSIGLVHLPITVLPYASGLFLEKKTGKKATYLLACALPFGIAFLDTCMGGGCIRYLADLTLPLVLFGLLTVFELCSKANQRTAENTSFRVFLLFVLILLWSAGIGFTLIFANERSWIFNGNPTLFRFAESLFGIR